MSKREWNSPEAAANGSGSIVNDQGEPMRTVLHGRHRLTKLLVVGGAVAIGAVAVPAAYAATTPPTGFVKICKVGASASVTGSFQFTVTGVKDPVTVPVGGCSKSIATTVRRVSSSEAAGAGFDPANSAANPDGREVSTDLAEAAVTGVGTLVSSDTASGTAVVKVASGATTVSYTNHKPGVTGCVRGDGYYKSNPDVVSKLVAKNGGSLVIGGVSLNASQVTAIYK